MKIHYYNKIRWVLAPNDAPPLIANIIVIVFYDQMRCCYGRRCLLLQKDPVSDLLRRRTPSQHLHPQTEATALESRRVET
jgi:hypothetical protein